MDLRHRADPRPGPRRRPPSRPRPQGPPCRAEGPAPADIVHRRPPRRVDSTRSGAATASLPPAITAALHHGTLHDLGKRRIVTGRDRHRDRKTKTRPAFPAAGRGVTTRTAAAQVSICAPVAA